jgi:hypothetical protein
MVGIADKRANAISPPAQQRREQHGDLAMPPGDENLHARRLRGFGSARVPPAPGEHNGGDTERGQRGG